jgi:hypothetical protein
MGFAENSVQLVVDLVGLVLVADELEEFVDVFGRHFEEVLLWGQVQVFGGEVLGLGEVLGAELFDGFEAFLCDFLFGVLWVGEWLEHVGGDD